MYGQDLSLDWSKCRELDRGFLWPVKEGGLLLAIEEGFDAVSDLFGGEAGEVAK